MLAVTLLGGCAARDGADREDIDTALMRYMDAHCAVESVVEREGLYTSTNLSMADSWLNDRLLTSPRVHVIWHSDDGIHARGELAYDQTGSRYEVWWDDFHPPGIEVVDQLVIRTCLFVPKRVDVIDTELGPHRQTARVLFTTPLGYSWVGGQLAALGLLTGNNSFPRSSAFEMVALLKATPSGAWAIETRPADLAASPNS